MRRRKMLSLSTGSILAVSTAGCLSVLGGGGSDGDSPETVFDRQLAPTEVNDLHHYTLSASPGDQLSLSIDSTTDKAGVAVYDAETGSTHSRIGVGPDGRSLGTTDTFTVSTDAEYVLWTGISSGTSINVQVQRSRQRESEESTDDGGDNTRSTVQRVAEAADTATVEPGAKYTPLFIWSRLGKDKVETVSGGQGVGNSYTNARQAVEQLFARASILEWMESNEREIGELMADAVITAIKVKTGGIGVGTIEDEVREQVTDGIEEILSVDSINSLSNTERMDTSATYAAEMDFELQFDTVVGTVSVLLPMVIQLQMDYELLPAEYEVIDYEFRPSEADVST